MNSSSFISDFSGFISVQRLFLLCHDHGFPGGVRFKFRSLFCVLFKLSFQHLRHISGFAQKICNGILVLARIELIFFVVAGKMPYFRSVLKIVVITDLYFSCCTEPRIFQLLMLPFQQGGGGAQGAGRWQNKEGLPKEYPTQHDFIHVEQ